LNFSPSGAKAIAATDRGTCKVLAENTGRATEGWQLVDESANQSTSRIT